MWEWTEKGARVSFTKRILLPLFFEQRKGLNQPNQCDLSPLKHLVHLNSRIPKEDTNLGKTLQRAPL